MNRIWLRPNENFAKITGAPIKNIGAPTLNHKRAYEKHRRAYPGP
jgi:hypothetical protein